MGSRHTSWKWSLLLALTGLAGCTTFSPQPPQAGPALSPAAPLRYAGKELTPAEQVEVSWAAAEEMKKQGLEAEALVHYEKVREHDPQHASLAWRLAVLYDRQGNADMAAAEYERALRADARNPDLLNDVGYFHLQRDDLPQAEKYLRDALSVRPEHERANVNLGVTLGRQGRVEDSLACFARVLPPAQARCNVGLILAQEGRVEEARRSLREALRLDPNLAQAKAFLARLESPAAAAALPPTPETPLARPAGRQEVRPTVELSVR
jgi:Tfp pilus assembly protein PilF